jgi:iron complex outermembrane recepter protein
MNSSMRLRAATWLRAVAVALVSAIVSAAHAQEPIAFDIPAQPLSQALITFGDQSGRGILASPELTASETSTALQDEATAETALDILLQGTGLSWQQDGDVFVIVREGSAAETAPADIDSARRAGVEEIIVTGQKKAERLQDVPIAISAFDMQQLDAKKIEGGFDLLKAIPNVTFSKSNFTGYNFQVRGIGTQAVSATTDPGVAVSLNNTTLIVNRLFEQEYLDIERVEVLRGPQGTLFGRNATAGVINVITAKPVLGDEFGELKLEGGNYNAQRLRGHYNLPLGDNLAARVAYSQTQRDGYGYNEFDGSDVDNRDLWTGRLSLGWEPSERLRINLMWERFEEDDERVRSAKQLCTHDPGLESVAGFDLVNYENSEAVRGAMSQGCLPGSLYDAAAYGVPNQRAIGFVMGAKEVAQIASFFYGSMGQSIEPNIGDCPGVPTPIFGARQGPIEVLQRCGNVFGVSEQSRDLRSIYSVVQPVYQASSDIFELSLDYDWGEGVTFSSQTVYAEDTVYSVQDYGRFETAEGAFTDTHQLISGGFGGFAVPMAEPFRSLSPGGVFCDPQLGCSDRMLIVDLSQAASRQFNQEFRWVSSFGGDFDFSFGANYTRFETMNDYYVFSNLLSAMTQAPPFFSPLGVNNTACTINETRGCVYVDPNRLDQINGEGHNYFRSANPYQLQSAGLFGETYWRFTDTLKLTAGLRYTWDRKVFTPMPSQTLLNDYRYSYGAFLNGDIGHDGPAGCASPASACTVAGNAPFGRGYPALPDIIQTWTEPTGRLVLDWQPYLSFTDETLVYASYSRGYKAGGANPPGIAEPAGLFIEKALGAEASRTFDAEYVNAYELGTKNTLLDGAVMLNGTVFYYDYEDYQVSKIVNRSANNENFDAKVWGAELEAVFAPSHHWQFNAAVGWLKTRIAEGEQSLDLMDRTQGGGKPFETTIRNPNFGYDGSGSNPPAPVAAGLGADQPDNEFLVFDEWVVVKANPTQPSNCVAPAELVRHLFVAESTAFFAGAPSAGLAQHGASVYFNGFCPAGTIAGTSYRTGSGSGKVPNNLYLPGATTGDYLLFNPLVDAPNFGAGFLADLGGNELPNAPEFTVSLGAQFSTDLPAGWDLSTRVDYYWQDRSFARVYNTEYDRLKAWASTNLSLWLNQQAMGLSIEAYVKNVFDETPITGAFLNSDDTGLSTNIFTLDPRLVGVSITKRF